MVFFGALPMANGKQTEYAIVIHGGAGSARRILLLLPRQSFGEGIGNRCCTLEEGGTSLDAVEKVIRILEDSPLFNAGRGGVLTAKGTNELDATIMNGKTRACGAVGGVTK